MNRENGPNQGSLDLGDLASTHEMGLVGPDYWTYAQVKDWILLDADIAHAEVRVYGIIRSLATRWRNDQKITKDRLRFMCPGVNGKPMGERTFDGVLKSLAARKLIEIQAAGSASLRNPATGRFEKVEQVFLRVNELPEEGVEFAGFHTVRDAFDSYPGPGWDAAQKERNSRSRLAQKSAEGSRRAQKSADGGDRAQKSAQDPLRSDHDERDETPGGTGSDAARFSAGFPQKSADDTAPEQAKPGAPNVFPDSDGNSFRPSGPVGNAHATESDGYTEADGRTDNLGEQNPRMAAAALLAEAEVTTAVDRLKPYPSQRSELASRVAGALEQFAVDQVRGYLLAKCRETVHRRITFVLTAFEAGYLPDVAGATAVEHADVRAARLAEQQRAEQVRQQAKAAARSEAPAPALPQGSPVDWLSDDEFAALSHQDRGFVRVWAESTGDVPKHTADRIAAIRNRRDNSAVA